MLARRSLFICSLLVTACKTASAEDNLAVQTAPKTPPAAPAAMATQISFNSVPVDGPYIAITFDDGPSEKLTPKLLDLLAAQHIKATFFVIGQNAAAYPAILKRIVREGHEIGNHSWSHPSFAKLSDESVRRELRKTDDAIAAVVGRRPTLLRPPYGSITPRQKRWIYDEFGYQTILWDVDPLDWKRPGPSVIANRIVKGTRSGAIILSHDIHPGTIEAMPATLADLAAKGFKFTTVSELIAMARPVTPVPAIISPPPLIPAPIPMGTPAAGRVPPNG
jgi:peptidoglycan/xylan/chitin deacetylase (PgdA/CDA1 family)